MFKYCFLPTDVPISIPKEMTKFKCLILVERAVDEAYRDEVSAALVKGGCLYALAWGLNCSAWDDSVDWAFLELHDFGPYPEEDFVMTTWHADETLADTIEFAKTCTQSCEVDLDDILVLDFSNQERGAMIKDLYLNAPG